jgi:hypothetical protein
MFVTLIIISRLKILTKYQEQNYLIWARKIKESKPNKKNQIKNQKIKNSKKMYWQWQLNYSINRTQDVKQNLLQDLGCLCKLIWRPIQAFVKGSKQDRRPRIKAIGNKKQIQQLWPNKALGYQSFQESRIIKHTAKTHTKLKMQEKNEKGGNSVGFLRVLWNPGCTKAICIGRERLLTFNPVRLERVIICEGTFN